MKLILIDESKDKKYVLCAVEIPHDQSPNARKVVNRARKKGQSEIHFVYESESRKKQILKIYGDIDLVCTNYVVRGEKEAIARTKCIEELIGDLREDETYSLVFDMDETHLKNDRSTISKALQKRGMVGVVEYMHYEPKFEVLLWLPDALAWVYAKGSFWK